MKSLIRRFSFQWQSRKQRHKTFIYSSKHIRAVFCSLLSPLITTCKLKALCKLGDDVTREILETFVPANRDFPCWEVSNEADTFPPVPSPHHSNAQPAALASDFLSVSITLRWGNLSLKKAFSFASLQRAASFCRTCRTSCFLAGAPTTTCPRRWPIGWGWNWGKWLRRSSATRRHGEYVATACVTLLVALFAESGALKHD